MHNKCPEHGYPNSLYVSTHKQEDHFNCMKNKKTNWANNPYQIIQNKEGKVDTGKKSKKEGAQPKMIMMNKLHQVLMTGNNKSSEEEYNNFIAEVSKE